MSGFFVCIFDFISMNGFIIDIYTGNAQRAPAWWVEHHIEWLYRLLKEPSRIKRQIHLVRFLLLLMLNRF